MYLRENYLDNSKNILKKKNCNDDDDDDDGDDDDDDDVIIMMIIIIIHFVSISAIFSVQLFVYYTCLTFLIQIV